MFIGKFAYNITVNYIGNYIDTYVSYLKQDISKTRNRYANIINQFTDRDDHFSVSSIINGLKYNLLKRINQIIMIILIIVNIPLYIYLLLTIIIKVIKIKLKEGIK